MVSSKRKPTAKLSVVPKRKVIERPRAVLQFRIELLGLEPPIWRRIEVPETYSFWDLHVAIQDAMGWSELHLHAFRVMGSSLVFGIPIDDGDDLPDTKPGWEYMAREFFDPTRCLASYEYDFSDSWIHEVRFEAWKTEEKSITRPRCLGGARKCPPEDCGGVPGYEEFIEAIRDPNHPEHEEMLTWCGGSFDPEEFDPAAVHFDNPKKRWRKAFKESRR